MSRPCLVQTRQTRTEHPAVLTASVITSIYNHGPKRSALVASLVPHWSVHSHSFPVGRPVQSTRFLFVSTYSQRSNWPTATPEPEVTHTHLRSRGAPWSCVRAFGASLKVGNLPRDDRSATPGRSRRSAPEVRLHIHRGPRRSGAGPLDRVSSPVSNTNANVVKVNTGHYSKILTLL